MTDRLSSPADNTSHTPLHSDPAHAGPESADTPILPTPWPEESESANLHADPDTATANIDTDLDADVNADTAEAKVEIKGKRKGLSPMRFSPFRRSRWGWLRHLKPSILDRYILKKFLGTYFLATLLILAVIAMFDITEKLDAFLRAPLKETLFDYFTSFLPYFANQLSPLFVFISVIFFTSKLAGNSEVIAMLSSGVSYSRLFRPYLIGAALIASLTFALSNYIIPPTNVKRIDYTNKYVKNKRVESGYNIQMQVSPGVVAFIGRFENPTKTGYGFSLDRFDGKTLTSRTTATRVTYDTLRPYHWRLHDYTMRDFRGMNENIRRGATLDTVITIEPRDFLISKNDQETLTTPQLAEYVEKQKMRGVANIKAFEIEIERRYAGTAAAFILTLIGYSLSAKKVKGGMGLNIGIGLLLSFSYILFSTITSSLAINGITTPFIAMQLPNAIYLIIALVLFWRLNR